MDAPGALELGPGPRRGRFQTNRATTGHRNIATKAAEDAIRMVKAQAMCAMVGPSCWTEVSTMRVGCSVSVFMPVSPLVKNESSHDPDSAAIERNYLIQSLTQRFAP